MHILKPCHTEATCPIPRPHNSKLKRSCLRLRLSQAQYQVPGWRRRSCATACVCIAVWRSLSVCSPLTAPRTSAPSPSSEPDMEGVKVGLDSHLDPYPWGAPSSALPNRSCQLHVNGRKANLADISTSHAQPCHLLGQLELVMRRERHRVLLRI